MSTANINRAMLSWARERLGQTVADFAAKMNQPEDKITAWESGAKKLTFIQAMRFAEKSYIPFGYLFLQKPPQDHLPIPDLRTVGNNGVPELSAELFDLIKLMIERQSWYKEYIQNNLLEPCLAVGRKSIDSSVKNIVEDIRKFLKVAPHPTRGDWEEYYRDLVKRIESVGILVMRQSHLGHYTRPLKVEEFRGFAIVDKMAPVIFVNQADAPGARLFTLIHELCHVWIGQSGISDGAATTNRQEEILCNAVSAEFLVPEIEFKNLWQHNIDDWQKNLTILEGHFHVSKWVLARRALTLKFISNEEYEIFIRKLIASYKNREKKGGPSYWTTKNSQISQNFSKAVVEQAINGQILLREASTLLDVKPYNIKKYARELGI
ncbi:ImmA/IrrE family metallo-endopeptidase [Pelagibaculum spongiae]|uniref:Peptidase n=1 Tax=Pelagibaculum spongiae TaxID=2080658 RepID=A0A2V1GYT2_9GAMM|nr:ImmA/IrrE family metallo-endopeptidase [Pelagibaculum spongiae]PVZ68216.1 peptidase [Pelagibaculum spongiae]